jgi:hypothetical protein
METAMSLIRTLLALSFLAIVSISGEESRTAERNALLARLTKCFAVKSEFWTNGAKRLTLQKGDVTYNLNHSGSEIDHILPISRVESQRTFTFIRVNTAANELVYGTSSSQTHPEFQANEKFASHRPYFEERLIVLLREFVPLCEALELPQRPN